MNNDFGFFEVCKLDKNVNHLLFFEQFTLSLVVDLMLITNIFSARFEEFIFTLKGISEMQGVPSEVVIDDYATIEYILKTSKNFLEHLGIKFIMHKNESVAWIVITRKFA